jgi:O-antigen/teichoic acid export membrane protein
MAAAEREIPIAVARGDEEGAHSLELAGVAISFVVSVFACAALFAVGVSRSSADSLLGVALICAAIILFTQQIGIWATVRLRTRLRFTALGWSSAAGAVAGAILSVVGASVDGAAGALAGVVIAAILQSVLLYRVAHLGGLAMAPTSSFRRLAGLSPAFLASGAAATLLLSIDQLAVGLSLGITSLGLYSAAYLGNAFVLRVPTLIGTVIYPRLQRELGATADTERVFAMALRTTRALVIAMPLFVAAFYVALPAVVFLALPGYRDAIGPMRLLLVGVVGLALAMPAAQYLLTVNRQWREVTISGSMLAVMAGAYIAAAAMGKMSLEVAAGVDVTAYLGYGVLMQVAAHRLARQRVTRLLRFMPILLLPTMELLVGSVAADALIRPSDTTGALLNSALQTALFGLTWTPLAWLHLRAHAESRGDLIMVTDLMIRVAQKGYLSARRFRCHVPK